MGKKRTFNPDRLRFARTAKRWGQERLAEEMGMSRTAVSGWEAPRGTKRAREPSTASLARLADLLLEGRTADYFYGRGSPL